ncbi:hypothetical protein M231_04665 [Tremella mesenterica]|uniref:Uncharacterized protein n=1 Tax=Tremella mesenterica TaxID=5217 RepID=A0A4Q1BK97_TREME|nr:hypothetical protein M231_04665 [Tremella mesenterica]
MSNNTSRDASTPLGKRRRSTAISVPRSRTYSINSSYPISPRTVLSSSVNRRRLTSRDTSDVDSFEAFSSKRRSIGSRTEAYDESSDGTVTIGDKGKGTFGGSGGETTLSHLQRAATNSTNPSLLGSGTEQEQYNQESEIVPHSCWSLEQIAAHRNSSRKPRKIVDSVAKEIGRSLVIEDSPISSNEGLIQRSCPSHKHRVASFEPPRQWLCRHGGSSTEPTYLLNRFEEEVVSTIPTTSQIRMIKLTSWRPQKPPPPPGIYPIICYPDSKKVTGEESQKAKEDVVRVKHLWASGYYRLSHEDEEAALREFNEDEDEDEDEE